MERFLRQCVRHEWITGHAHFLLLVIEGTRNDTGFWNENLVLINMG